MASDKHSDTRGNGTPVKRPTYVEVSSSIEEEIRNGTYPPGSRLPPQRQLATELGINVSTVSRAYKELQLRGLVIGSKRRGSLVTGGAMPSIEPARTALAAGSGPLDLTVNRPATGEFLASLAQTLGTLPGDPRFASLQEYQPPQGPDWARAAGAQWLAAPGFAPSRDRIVVTSGAQHGLYAVLNSLIGTDGVIVADRLTYYGLKALAPVFQFEIVSAPADDDGLLPDEIERICQRVPVKAIFVVPNLQNPTVTTMSLERRMALVDVARRHRVTIIEDDVYGPLVRDRLPTIAGLCPELTFHIGATSKILAPGLRLGYLCCPQDSVALCAEAVRTTAWMPAPMSMLIATAWIENGTAERIMNAQLAEIRARVDLARELLPAGHLKSDPACMFVWLRLPPPWRADDFAANAKARGVVVMPSSAFAVDRAEIEHGVRINLACAATRDQLVNGLRILAGTLKDRPRALFGSI
ncbi:GntR family transcriptional regulator [Burkholderia ubonensis]|uniref:GntR family transcriptional regulator n=2 Tax=Burkholderia ubonensis TaxID=101571 RepID=A0A106UGQ0_9BURK|nr:PLP-dependent aminotransferase family protein [Burkholderia ubonensis]KVC94241.1 GntR family transcriptional regulator [Burkholderia ubonensis]KVC96679.1 GntR family transcriptional regulator [Burkholderia ubonensis]KVD14950.1 GntR family transcriptional regulator [Burkholderia ubonensis]KVD47379.1 GntR family transcriptional regulator [Burkholderia ubonensis]KVG30453.1 GntR family transcriptional regulator [Burkholderia ubonensis]